MTIHTQHQYPNIGALLAIHAEELERNPYGFFEITYSLRKGWEAFVGKSIKQGERESSAIARSIGATAEGAALRALESITAKPAWLSKILAGIAQEKGDHPGIALLFERHSRLASLPELPNAFVEIAYTRHTGWCAWLCSDDLLVNPRRTILAHATGHTVDDAARLTAQMSHSLGGAYA
jgi:hypothetical protein